MERYLERKGNSALVELQSFWGKACFVSIPSTPRGTYHGLGIGVLNAKPVIGEEPFAVVLPNDFLDTEIPCMKSLVAIYAAVGWPVLAVHRVPIELLRTYGNVKYIEAGETISRQLVEAQSESKRFGTSFASCLLIAKMSGTVRGAFPGKMSVAGLEIGGR